MIPANLPSSITGRRPISFSTIILWTSARLVAGSTDRTAVVIKPFTGACPSSWVMALSTSRREMTPTISSPSVTGIPVWPYLSINLPASSILISIATVLTGVLIISPASNAGMVACFSSSRIMVVILSNSMFFNMAEAARSCPLPPRGFKTWFIRMLSVLLRPTTWILPCIDAIVKTASQFSTSKRRWVMISRPGTNSLPSAWEITTAAFSILKFRVFCNNS